MARGSGGDWTAIIWVVIIAAILLYLFSAFFVKGTTGYDFVSPSSGQVKEISLIVMKILLVGAVVFVAIKIAGMFGQNLTGRTAFTIILLAVLVWFLWENVLKNILQANSIDNIAFAVGQKLGFIKP